MTRDPNRSRNLTIVVVAGIGIAVAFVAYLVANVDSLRAGLS